MALNPEDTERLFNFFRGYGWSVRKIVFFLNCFDFDPKKPVGLRYSYFGPAWLEVPTQNWELGEWVA